MTVGCPPCEPPVRPAHPDENLGAALGGLADEAARRAFLAAHPELRSAEGVERLHAAAYELAGSRPPLAVAAADLAVSAARGLGAASRLKAWRARARLLYSCADYRRSVALFRRVARAHERRGDRAEAAVAILGQVASLVYLGRSEEALAEAARARAHYTALHDRLGRAKVDVNTGIVYQALDRPGAALACYRRGRKVFVRHGDTAAVAIIDLDCANTYSQLGHARRAAARFADARAAFARLGQTHQVVKVDYNRACDHLTNGRYDQAWHELEAVRAAFGAAGDPHCVALVDLDLAEIALCLGAAELAHDLARRARALLEPRGVSADAAHARCLEATALARMGEVGAAAAALDRAAAQLDQVGDPARAAQARLQLATLLVEDAPAEAAALARRSAVALRRGGLRNATVRALLVEGMARTRTSTTEARRLLCRAAALARRQGVPDVGWQAEAALGRLESAVGRPGAARRRFERAVAAVDRQRADLRRLDLSRFLLADRRPLYEEAMRAWLGDGAGSGRVEGRAADRVFDLAERARSHALADAVAVAGSIPAPAPRESQDETARLVDLRRRLDASYRALRRRRPDAGATVALARSVEADEAAMGEALRGFESEAAGMPAATPSAVKLRAALAPDQGLIEYQRIGEELWALVARREGVTALRLARRAEEVQRRVRELDYQLGKLALGRDFVRRHLPELRASIDLILDELGQLLLAPVLSRLETRSLVVVPTRCLYHIPFAALRIHRRYLVESATVSLAPSAHVHALLRVRRRTGARPPLVVGVGDAAMPQVTAEAREVASLFAQSELLLGEMATRERVRREVAGRSLVHFASHGFFRPQRPTLSSLLLGDGALTLHDVFRLPISADLVTLSACESGRSQVGQGDDLVGLARAFLQAGARSALVSLWAVDDGCARDVMRVFYGHYRRGRPSAESLRAAMLEVGGRAPHPGYWAPFTLVGAQ